MKPRRHGKRQRRVHPRTVSAAWLLVLLVAVNGLMWACTVTQKNYKFLSFIFDGVPDPNAPVQTHGPGAKIVDIQQSPTYSAHKPWLEEKCEECHTRTLKMGSRDSDLCLKCHAAKLTEHERMHGPVAVGACLWCHNPHNSAYAHLLKGPAREVCTQCHAPSMLDSQQVPAHADETRSCLECHYGHGGKVRFFLRQGGDKEPSKPEAATATGGAKTSP